MTTSSFPEKKEEELKRQSEKKSSTESLSLSQFRKSWKKKDKTACRKKIKKPIAASQSIPIPPYFFNNFLFVFFPMSDWFDLAFVFPLRIEF